MTAELYEHVDKIERDLKQFAEEVCEEIKTHRSDTEYFYGDTYYTSQDRRLNIHNGNNRLQRKYNKVQKLNKKFQKCYNDVQNANGTQYLISTPFPFLSTKIDDDFKRMKSYLRYMRLAGEFGDELEEDRVEAYRGWLDYNERMFSQFQTNRYSKFLRLNPLET